jgi:hypothetical protein
VIGIAQLWGWIGYKEDYHGNLFTMGGDIYSVANFGRWNIL